jgi:hypothetical protein
MHRATEAAFANTEMFEDFIDEWKRFWTAHPL